VNARPQSAALVDRARRSAALTAAGKVTGVTGPVVRVKGVDVSVGQQVALWPKGAANPVPAEVIGLDEGTALLMALGGLDGIGLDCEASALDANTLVPVGEELLGRVVDGLGRPLDGMSLPPLPDRYPLRGAPPKPLARARIDKVLPTGVRAIDAFLTVGTGQRLGIFAGAGVGKSTLLGMLARHGDFDACVIALVGERGREVREFIEDAIDERNRPRTCVVAVTGDAAPLLRVRGALLATSIAEHLRAKGRRVVLLLDSLTRYAMALREVGLASGELPATKGYPPSVFAELARLLERAGTDEAGSITGIYTVLVEGDEMTDPVADATRALLDGHVVLGRNTANRGIFPAIDVLDSKSRLMSQIATQEHLATARRAVAILANYKQAEDLIRIGAYQPGSDPDIDVARKFVPEFEKLVMQEPHAPCAFDDAVRALKRLVDQFGGKAK
jgi:flagellum-specific ATP synthase